MEKLSADLDVALTIEPTEDLDLQKTGQKEKELPEKLDELETTDTNHAELSDAIGDALSEAASIRRIMLNGRNES